MAAALLTLLVPAVAEPAECANGHPSQSLAEQISPLLLVQAVQVVQAHRTPMDTLALTGAPRLLIPSVCLVAAVAAVEELQVSLALLAAVLAVALLLALPEQESPAKEMPVAAQPWPTPVAVEVAARVLSAPQPIQITVQQVVQVCKAISTPLPLFMPMADQVEVETL